MFRCNESYYSYIEATERCRAGKLTLGLAPGVLEYAPAHVTSGNQPEALVVSKGYHMITAITIPVNRVATRLERNAGKYCGGRSVRARGRYGGRYIHETSFREFNITSYCK